MECDLNISLVCFVSQNLDFCIYFAYINVISYCVVVSVRRINALFHSVRFVCILYTALRQAGATHIFSRRCAMTTTTLHTQKGRNSLRGGMARCKSLKCSYGVAFTFLSSCRRRVRFSLRVFCAFDTFDFVRHRRAVLRRVLEKSIFYMLLTLHCGVCICPAKVYTMRKFCFGDYYQISFVLKHVKNIQTNLSAECNLATLKRACLAC